MARRELDRRGLQYEELDVERDRSAWREMVDLSGQTLTPTLVMGPRVLPDFGPEELEGFLAGSGGIA